MYSADSVATHLGLKQGDPQREALDDVVGAVRVMVSRWKGQPTPDTWDDDVALGATMLAARLHRRRNSPSGVESFNELGAVYVSRRDPDVAMLLGLGEWTPPQIG